MKELIEELIHEGEIKKFIETRKQS